MNLRIYLQMPDSIGLSEERLECLCVIAHNNVEGAFVFRFDIFVFVFT